MLAHSSTARAGTCRPFTASVRPATVSRAPLSVVAVKPTKAADFRTLSSAELVEKAYDLKRQLATVRFMQKTKGVSELKAGVSMEQPDPEKIPKGNMNAHLRRQVAQLWTLLRERTIKDGVTRRQYASMMKSATLKAGFDFIY